MENLKTILNLITGAVVLSLFSFILLLFGFVPFYDTKNDEKQHRLVCGTCEQILNEQYLNHIRNQKMEENMTEATTKYTEMSDLEKGKSLWEGNCTSCHSLNDEVVVGPGLKNILERRDINWLIPWVKNSQAVIKSGDKYAVELFMKYNKAVMTSFALKDDEIKAIFSYIKQSEVQQSKAKPQVIACP